MNGGSATHNKSRNFHCPLETACAKSILRLHLLLFCRQTLIGARDVTHLVLVRSGERGILPRQHPRVPLSTSYPGESTLLPAPSIDTTHRSTPQL